MSSPAFQNYAPRAGNLDTAGDGQPIDTTRFPAPLKAMAALTPAADRLVYYTSASAAALATLSSYGRTVLGLADAAALRSNLGLVIGTDVQAYDAELSAIAGLVSAADKVPYFTGSGTAALTTFTGIGRNFVGSATGTLARRAVDAAGGSYTFFTTGALTLRTFTVPNEDATLARTDAAQTFTGPQTFSSVSVSGTYTADSAVKVGSLEFQPFALNNCWLGDNIYYSGGGPTGFQRRATGAASQVYFNGAEIQFRVYPAAAAGDIAANLCQFKAMSGGTVAMGGIISDTPGSTSGALLVATGSGVTVSGSVTATSFAGDGSALTGIASLPVVDSTAVVKGSSDPTKLVKISAAGLSTGVTCTVTAPNTASTALLISTYSHTLSGTTAARTITLPDANFTVARTDAANTFLGTQTFRDASGSTNVIMRQGSAQSGNILSMTRSDGVETIGFDPSGTGTIYGFRLKHPTNHFDISDSAWLLDSDLHMKWTSGPSYASPDLGTKRDSAGFLRITDGSSGYGGLRCASLGVGNSASASALGTCVKKIQIFDAAGTSLGYIPVYDAIT